MATGILIFLLWDVLAARRRAGRVAALHAGGTTGASSASRCSSPPASRVGLLCLVCTTLAGGGAARRCSVPVRRRSAEFELERISSRCRRRAGSRSSSRRGSACTTSRRGWRSGSRRRPTSEPRACPDHRLRAPQRDRGLRHRGPARRGQGSSELAFLAALGVIGGAPTFVGTLVGQAWMSTALSVAFLALAAGSILYVVIELIMICGRNVKKEAHARRGPAGPRPRLRHGLRARRRRRLTSRDTAYARRSASRGDLSAGDGARARAAFTYRVPDDVEQGDVLSIRLGARKVRGVVVNGRRGPARRRGRGRRGRRRSRSGAARRARALARGLLRLHACPRARTRRAVPRPPAWCDPRPVRPRPWRRARARSATQGQKDAVAHIVAALDAGGGHVLPPADRERKDGGVPPGDRGGARARPRRHRARPEIARRRRPSVASVSASVTGSPCSTRP